jgi:hypothetical protein
MDIIMQRDRLAAYSVDNERGLAMRTVKATADSLA